MANLTNIFNLLDKNNCFSFKKHNFSPYWSLFSPFRPKPLILPIWDKVEIYWHWQAWDDSKSLAGSRSKSTTGRRCSEKYSLSAIVVHVDRFKLYCNISCAELIVSLWTSTSIQIRCRRKNLWIWNFKIHFAHVFGNVAEVFRLAAASPSVKLHATFYRCTFPDLYSCISAVCIFTQLQQYRRCRCEEPRVCTFDIAYHSYKFHEDIPEVEPMNLWYWCNAKPYSWQEAWRTFRRL